MVAMEREMWNTEGGQDGCSRQCPGSEVFGEQGDVQRGRKWGDCDNYWSEIINEDTPLMDG